MAQTGYTPILIYASGTTGNAPSAANLTSSASGAELALNYFDGKLFYKDASGNVQVLAGKGGTGVVAGSNTQVQFNNNGVFGASANLTWDGSTLSTTGFTASGTVTFSGGTANGVAYLNGSKVLTTGGALTFDGTTFTASNSAATAGNFKATSSTAQVVQLTASNDANTSVGLLVYGSAAGSFGMLGAGSPALYTAASELNLMANNASGVIKFAAGGNTEQMRLTSKAFMVGYTSDAGFSGQYNAAFSGSVGIGTSSPSNPLTLFGANASTTNGAQFKIANTTGTAGATRLSLAVDDANHKVWFINGGSFTNPSFNWATNDSNTALMTLDASGNLGIGTPSPAVKMHVYGSGTYLAGLESTSAYSYLGLRASGSGGSMSDPTVGIGANANDLAFRAGGSEKMRLDSSGNLGIGTSSPNRTLDVNGNIQSRNANTNLSYVYFASYADPTSSYSYVAGDGRSTGYLALYTNNAEKARLDSSGNLGLGVTPSAWYTTSKAIEIGYAGSAISSGGAGDIGIFSAAKFGPSTSFTYSQTGVGAAFYNQYNGRHAWYTAPSGTAGNAISFTQAMTLDASGNLLVGTTDTGYTNVDSFSLEKANGYQVINHNSSRTSGALYVAFGYNGGGIGSITQNGTTGVLYNITSDQRLKENIQDADSASALIDSLQVRKYDWKADGSHQRYGFIAQELVTVAPEAVHQPEDPEEMMAVDYSKLVPMLVKEIQSLRARVAQLEAK